MGRLADQLFGRAFVDDEEEYQRRLAEEASQGEVAPPSPDVAVSIPGMGEPSAPQGTMPTAQEQDVPVGPQPWQQTATDIAESAPGRFVRAAAEAVPKTLENVGTVAGMMVGAPLIAQGAKAIPGIAATALQVARNPMAALRERPMAGPAATLGAEVATEPEKFNPITGGPAAERFADPAIAAAKAAQRSGPLAALGREAVSGPAMPSELQGMARVSRDANFASNTVEYNNLMAQAKEARKRGDFAEYTRLRSEAGKFSPSYFTGRPIVESVPALPTDPVERMRVINRGMAQRRVTPEITAQKEAAIAARNAEAKAASEAEAAALEAERGPSVDPFRDATDAEAARRRASTLDLGGERGAALIPGRKELKEFASHFQFQPKLEEFMLKPGYTVADAAARLRTANAAEPWLATRESKSILRDVPFGERFRAWITGSQTKDAIAFRQYVEAADELENLRRGQVVASGRDQAALMADMAQAENAIGKPRMDELRGRLKEITDASFDELVAAGEADPSMYRPDYVRNIYTEKARERMTAFGGSGAGGFGAAKPGATNARKGFDGDKEDVLSATAFGRYEAGKAYNFAKTIRDPVVDKFSLNEALRRDPQAALAGDTVLFTFDHGVSNRIINQYATKRVLSGMDPVQLNPALKTQAFQYGVHPDGKPIKYHAIPGPLAEGLADLMANEGEFGKFSQVMAKANQATTTSLLSFPVTNLPYEVGQLMSDTGSALQAVAGMGGVKDILTGKGPRILVKESAKALRELAAEYTNVYWRKLRPTLIRDLTRKNLFGVNWESMYEDISDAAPEVARLVSENALPMHERGKGAAAKAVFLSPYAITDLVGKARESTLMRGVSKAAETLIPGMSSEGATALARARMGGYDKKSAAGRAFAPLMLFHKWFLSAAQNLTTRAVQDPLTKKWGGWKRLPQNMAKSPLVGVGITYALLKAWNRGAMGEWGREVEDNVLPSTQTAAFVMPVTDKGEYVGPGADLSKVAGKPVVIEPETFLQMVLAGIGGAFDAATGKSGRAAEDLARFTASRGAPIVRGPIEALMGQRIKDSSSIAGKFSDASNERQAAELRRRGVPWAGALEKLPFSPMGTEHVLEQLSYAPSFTRRTLDPNQTAWERAQTLGSPFRVVEPNAKEFEAKMRDTKRVMAEIDRENTKANPDKARIDALKNQLRELGADQQATKGQLTRWRRATQEAESRTRPEREEKKYRRLPDRFRKWLKEKSEAPPAPSGGPP